MSDYMFLSGHRQLLYLIDFQHVKELFYLILQIILRKKKDRHFE